MSTILGRNAPSPMVKLIYPSVKNPAPAIARNLSFCDNEAMLNRGSWCLRYYGTYIGRLLIYITIPLQVVSIKPSTTNKPK